MERAPSAGREVRYRLRPGAVAPASDWLGGVAAAWDRRLERLRDAVEGPATALVDELAGHAGDGEPPGDAARRRSGRRRGATSTAPSHPNTAVRTSSTRL